jgi:protein disulfide-isomerase A6
MKPDWDKLAKEYESSSSVIIADVDCTSDEGKPVCNESGVQGYPTIKYWKDGVEEKYQGGRDFSALSKFVEDELQRGCDISEPDSCSEKEKKYMDKMKAKGADAVAKQLARLEGMKEKSMKPELKTWVFQRLAILQQMAEKSEL